MPETPILFIGDAQRSEFRRAFSVLGEMGQVARADDSAAAVEMIASGETAPELIVVAQAFPGQFSCEAVETVQRAAPLARVLGLLGSWCEGEMRTGQPWPGVVRTYWHQWPARCNRQLEQIARGECSAWGLPITATDEERLLSDSRQPIPPGAGLVAIYTRKFEMEDWLSAALRARGCSTVWLRPPHPALVEGARAALFDGSDLRGGEPEELEHVCRELSPVPVIALLDFPRIEDRRRALEAGAAGVVSKPVQLEDLAWEMEQVTG